MIIWTIHLIANNMKLSEGKPCTEVFFKKYIICASVRLFHEGYNAKNMYSKCKTVLKEWLFQVSVKMYRIGSETPVGINHISYTRQKCQCFRNIYANHG